MNGAALGLAWTLSFLPTVLDALSSGNLSLGEASHLGLASLPWIALAGFPSAAREPARAPGRPWWLAAAAAAPPLALAAGLDRAASRGSSAAPVLAELAVALVLVLLWGGVAERSRRRRGSAGGLAWLLLVPGLAALSLALDWVPRVSGEPAPAPASWSERLSSLVLFARVARGEALDLAGAAIAVVVALLAFAMVLGLERRPREAAGP
jgi:hypothetical protein